RGADTMSTDHGLGADRAALAEGAAELGMYLQRVAQAMRTGRVGELAHDISDGASVAAERQLPLIFEEGDQGGGRLRGLANRCMGRELAAEAASRAAELERRREAMRPRVVEVDRERGYATFACPDPARTAEEGP